MSFLPKILTEYLHDAHTLFLYLGFVLVSFVVGWILSVLLSYWGELLGEIVVRNVRHDIFSNLERLSMLTVYARGPGEFVQEMDRDVMMVRGLVGGTLINSGMEIALGTTTLVSMLVLDPWITLGILVMFLLMAGVIRSINHRVEYYAGQARDLMQELLGRLVEYVGAFRDIVAAGRFRDYTARFDDVLKESQKLNVRTAVWGQLSGLVPAMIVNLAVLGVYAFGVSRGPTIAEIGVIITYATLLQQLFPAILAAAKSTTDLALAVPSLQALKQILDQPPDASSSQTVPLNEPIRTIEFDHVTLELNGRTIVTDLTFAIPTGKLVAIVGQSGAGKTTIFHLLLRLIEPTSGIIRVNGRPLSEYSLESLRKHVGFLPQNPFIFNQSLRENILLASSEKAVSEERLAQVVELSQLQQVVQLRAREGGLNATAGYMGNRLSGGERQRVALARLVLRDPETIVCDEYTAGVDVKTARLIQEAIRTQFAGRTRVVITRELYNARGADWVIVIEQGRVVQQGTNEELSTQPGFYRELLEVQKV
jgi:ATP-binding cassette subfamily B protein